MIDLDDVKAHLSASRDELPWDDETISNVLRAEHGAQRSVCTIPSSGRTEALDKALLRRVEINLEATNGDPLVRMASDHPDVVALEEPHSIRFVPPTTGDTAATPTTDGGRSKRSTRKKTQSRKD